MPDSIEPFRVSNSKDEKPASKHGNRPSFSQEKEAAEPDRPAEDPNHCGGYNEAFILQYWSSYSPRQ